MRIGEIKEVIVNRGDHNDLWWQWHPEPSEPALFELVLSAAKGIPQEELIKVAESVQ